MTFRYMHSRTRNNKKIDFFELPDHARLEQIIHKEKRVVSIETSSSLIDISCEQATIDTTQASIYTNP